MRPEPNPEVALLSKQLVAAARREEALRKELEETCRTELKLHRKLTRLEVQLEERAAAASPAPAPAPVPETDEILKLELEAVLKRVRDLDRELSEARQEVESLRKEKSAKASPLPLLSAVGNLSRAELVQALTTACQELQALREGSQVESRALGAQLGAAASRERSLRAEIELRAKTELQLRRKLGALERELGGT